jgi:hypothetical protein
MISVFKAGVISGLNISVVTEWHATTSAQGGSWHSSVHIVKWKVQ